MQVSTDVQTVTLFSPFEILTFMFVANNTKQTESEVNTWFALDCYLITGLKLPLKTVGFV